MISRHLLLTAAFVVASGLLSMGASAQSDTAMSRDEAYRVAAAAAVLGKQMFFDPSLSGSGSMSCASCHDPKFGFAPPNALPVQLGGAHLDQPGLRNVPALTYIQSSPPFTEHFFDNEDEGDESVDNGPTGGLTWDGRVDRGSAQAKIPLLSPFEMANPDAASVVASVAKSSYAANFKALYGADIFNQPDRAFDHIAEAFEAYEQSYKDFYPYSSKYDAYLKGTAQLTAQEKHGLDLFEDETKGNCSSCHLSQPSNDGTPPQFTDFGMLALAVPRNAKIPANNDPDYFDLGACGPQRTDLKDHPEYCGLFLTPSLRNVALRQSFFHNGEFHSLRDVVEFYATRDTNPAKWYPRKADGTVDEYDDLPQKYWDNINKDAPFGGKPGDPPRLTDAEIDDIVAFLKTLTDGYSG
jgi:cytochrome c peroxidase